MKSLTLLTTFLLLTITLSAPATPSQSEDEYIVLLAPDNKNSWSSIFSSMGYNRTTRHVSAHNTYGVRTLGATFLTSHGTNIQTFGDGENFRGFTMKMPRTHSVNVAGMEGIAIVEKNHRRGKQMPKVSLTHSVRNIKHSPPSSSSSYSPQGVYRRYLHRRQQQPATNPNSTTEGGFTTELIQQSTAPWGLQRISSQPPIPADGRNITELTYKHRFDRTAGTGVDIYIVDSGIKINHSDFNGRAKVLFSAFNDSGDDKDGHGTHVAGTAGSLHYGVAKNSNLWGVKVLDDNGGGSDSGIAAGIDAVLTAHNKRKEDKEFAGSVINMSLGAPETSQVIFTAIKRAVEAGIHFTIAPGNDNKDSCTDFPAGFVTQLPSLITVGATDIDDNRADFSDFGKCVDIHAPGVMIVSTTNDGNIADKDGTSMATPAVAGVVADLLAQNERFKLDPMGMKKFLLEKSLKGVIKLKAGDRATDGGTERVLLNTGVGGVPK
ncbi:hypothetical protein TWF192_004316 [Orbilia oligospora]|uniref:Peptidase S8/S53 domain-containing protein n=1 Tax=Orbilia oligospora TaxID=2813651 RepID=A0A6G1MBU1_ORBOL|nr:hypothetical protein TWF191_002752 [Orbilia oligospora]KAF3253031.1 hypothetical protein TWF192_004316 [Orbilia oligospora]